ncbi:Sporulation protein YtxC [Evansella cellulosilytica DSM 2522]|uniref:Sporulation protein YtxC n=1 Tax=Evansella cellulosilytica (strain ATCC 21833 / DSM 2522 / FERM P-1141 / JCM 9156 / N-4) TaxID=649639 RepID=E6U0K0_EVAC2|nr:Sporulation protein YtxC [Evansella cellulosilytica DSM 2522]
MNYSRDAQLDLHDWEGLLLLTIQFKDSSLCEAFYHQLLHSLSTYGGVKKSISIEKTEQYTNLSINFSTILGGGMSQRKKLVATVLTNVTIKKFLPIWLEECIRGRFYFEDQYEVGAIIEHAREVFFNEKPDVPLKTNFIEWQKELFMLYYHFIKEAMHFSFDSFIIFRLRKFKLQLVDVVEKAIDEYKIEHDYQVMLNTCREFLRNHESRIDTIHVYLNENIEIQDDSGESISLQQIRNWLTRDLMFEDPLPLSQRVIGPLVCIAPKKIFIYPHENEYDGLVQTLLSIFEERVNIVDKEDTNTVNLLQS